MVFHFQEEKRKGFSMIKAEHKDIHESVIIGENVSIECEKVTIGKYSRIGNNVKIKCKELIIGNHLYTADNVEIGRGGCTGPNSVVKIGNGVGIFENVAVRATVPVVTCLSVVARRSRLISSAAKPKLSLTLEVVAVPAVGIVLTIAEVIRLTGLHWLLYFRL